MPRTNDDATVPVELGASECWDYIRQSSVGRLAVISGGRPEIFPINFAVDHGSVVFRTAEGTKLSAALDDSPVAFEIDGYDDRLSFAWSVVLKGTASRLESIEDVLDSAELELFPWQEGEKNHFIRIEPEEISGRRFLINNAARRHVLAARRRQAFTE
ncbi:pyridoxamine 5'-phosphate oxidase family protein [Arthrobacter sp. zg-Y916]|uniref:Pyridoxamine 5'-phosphate oxidase family protein n=1 Tax=Arthrobacter caoxuetaonis TaxID=2886935 RepID=A0A9X1MAR5_9MICC|nr:MULTISPECIES: pyridoxamine 5'-phosphate oxidase family protein [Arthrobacter]MCC3296301.1 pyridoxamine 5'-phosphate oxidase family protein [Arthrobacter caoxuetaonis]MCC9192377.1 pyridoxamine 5'-phosphate oxidase family protein [Arthrobacter sp. zg-Y916]USQ56852.1 pyridoxamine 5'-phosphate oxidase family protein [Arthrobacter caoxuetaonis]